MKSIILQTLLITCILIPPVASAEMIRDMLHRDVSIPKEPQRIVSLAPSITEIIYSLGKGEKLVGATLFSNYPEDAQRLPKVGSYVHPDIEKIVALRPDLCIATKDGNPKSVIERLHSLSIPVFAIDPRRLESLMVSMRTIGRVINAQEEANRQILRMQQEIGAIQKKVSNVHHRPKTLYIIEGPPLISAGTHTFIHELIGLAGGRNLAAGEKSYPHFSLEEIVLMSPEVIIFSTMDGEDKENKRKIFKHLRGIPAVRNNRVFAVNSDIFDRPSPRLIFALKQLVNILHPEISEGKQ